MTLTPGPKEFEFNNWYDTKFKPAMERAPLDKYVARQAWFAATAPLLARIAELEDELETERIRLAACGVVAMADTPESAAKQRQMLPKYWSASCGDVIRRVDECMALRSQVAALTAQVEQAAQPVGWQKAILRSEEDCMVIIGWDYCTEAEFGHLRIPKRKLYIAPPQVEMSAHPVAWLYSTDQGKGKPWASTQPPSSHDLQGLADAEMLVRPLYTSPPKAAPLTEAQQEVKK